MPLSRSSRRSPVSPSARFLQWQARTRVFEGVAATQNDTVNLTDNGDPARLRGVAVSTNFFTVVGMLPLLGRTFTVDDEHGSPNLVILSEAVWRGRFGGAPDIVGKSIRLDDTPTLVVGVMPASFTLPSVTTDLWQPWQISADDRTRYGSHYLVCLARMKPGTTIDQARQDLARASREIEGFDEGNKGWTTLLDPMQAYIVRNVRLGLWVLAGAVGFVLLIACANIANLLLARGAGRQREFGIRAAMGASRVRLIRQMLVENLIVGVAGGAAGLALAAALLKAIIASPSTNLPRAQTIALDIPTMLFALALVVLTPLIFGLIPALQASRTDLRDVLAQGGRSGSAGVRTKTRGLLVIAEVALAVMLVAGSILLIRSFGRLMDVNPGFSTDEQIVVAMSLPATRYKTDQERDLFWQSLLTRAVGLPGVEAAAITQSTPLANDFVTTFESPGRTSTDLAQMPNANFYAVSAEFFKTMGIPLLRGRAIATTDAADARRVVVISKSLADKYFSNEDPIGKTLRVYQGPSDDFGQIVGVVGDTRQYGLDQPAPMQVYASIRQHAYFANNQLIVRSRQSPDAIASELRALLKEIDPTLPIAAPRTMASLLESSVGSRRFTTTLLGGFAGVALLLAVIGVYGLVSFTVGQRTQEIGIRLALGAQRSNVMRLVFGQGLGLTIIGIAVGMLGGLWAAQLLETQLFDIAPRDPIAFMAAPAVLFVAAMFACYWPARRAMRVSPVAALRDTY